MKGEGEELNKRREERKEGGMANQGEERRRKRKREKEKKKKRMRL
jgi:hypothetical protein